MAQTVANKIKSIQILEKPSSRAATASTPSDEQPQGDGLFGASACSKTPIPASSEAVVRIVHEGAPKTVSDMDPSKRRAHYKPVTPDEDWRPEWGPRKRRPGLTKEDRALMRRVATEAMVGLPEVPEVPEYLPTDAETGRVVKSPELLDALCAYLAQGGMMLTFAKRVGLGRSMLSQWCSKDPKWKAAVAKAREQGVDALAEEALAMATDPLMVEDVYERYDNDGNLLSMDVKKGDAVYARKLAVSTRLDLLKKWAPEKYGDKVEAKTDSSLASRILAARQRVAGK